MKLTTMAIKMYNKMPTKNNAIEKFWNFKQRLKLFLLDHPFYFSNEFLYMKKTIYLINNNVNKIRQK